MAGRAPARCPPRAGRGCGSRPSARAGPRRSAVVAELPTARSVELGFAGVDWLVREVSRRPATPPCSNPRTRAPRSPAAEWIRAGTPPLDVAALGGGRVSRRDLITMSPSRAGAVPRGAADRGRATNGPSGWPHLMPLWYLVRGEDSGRGRSPSRRRSATWSATRGPPCRWSPASSTSELRGVMIEADAVIHRDPDLVNDFGLELFTATRRRRPGDPRRGTDAGGQARGAAVRAAPDGHLGPPQARRYLLSRRRSLGL